jgi:DNA-binding beta-propeller fold protein YncE
MKTLNLVDRSVRGGWGMAAVPLALALLLASHPAHAQRMPQDSWYEELKFGSSGAADGQFNFGGVQGGFKGGGLTVGSNGSVLIADTGNNRIQIFSKDGNFIRKWGTGGSGNSQFSAPRGIAIGPNGLIYVADSANNRIQVFQENGTFLRKWACNSPTAIAINQKTGLIYVTDNNSKQVRVFEDNGVSSLLKQSWGSEGNLDGQFDDLRGIGIDASGNIIVCAYSSVQKFTPDGEFISATRGRGKYSFNCTPDGLLLIGTGPDYGYGYGGNSFYILDGKNENIFYVGYGEHESVAAMCSDPTANSLYVATIKSEIRRYDRSYRTQIPLSKRKALPIPVLIDVKQRAGTTYLDIDFKVNDSDSQSIDVAALGFIGGGNSLSSVIPIQSLVENTDLNLGVNKPVGVEKRITWNVAADWQVDFGQIQVELLAKDEQGLFAFHWITIPSSGSEPSLAVSESPISDEDLLSLWFWWVARADTALRLSNGSIYGLGGKYDGLTLASGSSTTSQGRQFIYERLGVRSITAAELTRAQSGNYNFKSLSLNSLVKIY